MKGAIAAGEAKLEETRKQFAGTEQELRRELEEEKNLREMERDRNAVLAAAQASLGQMIKDTDAKALSMCSYPLLTSFIFLLVYSHAGFFPILLQSCFRILRSAR